MAGACEHPGDTRDVVDPVGLFTGARAAIVTSRVSARASECTRSTRPPSAEGDREARSMPIGSTKPSL
jgi:hypothetical protein